MKTVSTNLSHMKFWHSPFIVCTGVSTSSKIHRTFFAKPPAISANCPNRLFRQFTLYIGFSAIFYVKSATPTWKRSLPFSQQPPLKIEILSRPPKLFENLIGGSQPRPSTIGEGRGLCTIWHCKVSSTLNMRRKPS